MDENVNGTNVIDYGALGKKIRAQRLNMGLSQEKLSEMLGLSIPYYSRIECGERSLTIETLVKISKTMGLKVEYLLSESFGSSDVNDDKYEIVSHIQKLDKSQTLYLLTLIRVLIRNIDELTPKPQ